MFIPSQSCSLLCSSADDDDVDVCMYFFYKKPGGIQSPGAGGACDVVQSPGRDHTAPEFRLRLDAEDDRSNVILKLDVGTVPGGSDVVNKKELGGFSTALTEVFISEINSYSV